MSVRLYGYTRKKAKYLEHRSKMFVKNLVCVGINVDVGTNRWIEI